MPGPFVCFIGDFISLINDLPIQHRILIVGDFNLDQMLSEHVAKVDPLIQNFNLSQRFQLISTCLQLIYLCSYWIWYLILQIPTLFLLCCHHTVISLFFSKSDALYLYKI